MGECLATIRVDESQKSLLWTADEGILRHLEAHKVVFRYCRLCEDLCQSESHFVSKPHLKRRDELAVKPEEDLCFSQLVF